MVMCHMLADSLEELHEMALRIGINKKWFQNKSKTPHYDICSTKRAMAVAFGAIEIDRKKTVEIIRKLRGTQDILFRKQIAENRKMGEFNFNLLRKANITRLPKYRNSKGEINHKRTDGSDWPPEQWLQALIGEVGEFGNFRKKYERGDYSVDEFKIQGGKELADAQIYLDLLAMRCMDYNGQIHKSGLSLQNLPHSDSEKFKNLFGLSAPRCFQALTAKIGKYADLRESLEMGECDFETYVESLPITFGDIQHHLEILAKSALNLNDFVDDSGIDLWKSTIDKFNEVSHRVNVNVFIRNNDVMSL